MRKLSGGTRLDCGHYQVVSIARQHIASAGYEQDPVWCVECNEWSSVPPVYIPEPILAVDSDGNIDSV